MADHKVTLELNTKAGAGFTAPFERLEAAARKAQGAIGVGGQAAGGNPLGAAAGMIGKLGPLGAAVGMALEKIPAAASKAADSLLIFQNKLASAGEKQDRMAEAFGFGWLIKLRDAVTGVTQNIIEARLKSESAMLKSRQSGEEMRLRYSVSNPADFATIRARAFGGAEVPNTLLHRDRSTYAGELAYQQAATRFPAQAGLARAQTEAFAARQNLQSHAGILPDMTRKLARDQFELERLQKQHAALRKTDRRDFGTPGNKEDIAKKSLSIMEQSEMVLQQQRTLEQEITRQKELGLALSEKESGVRKAQNNLLKAEADILRGREQRMAGAAGALGGMNPAQRAMAVQALKMAQGMGDVGMLPPALRGLAQQVAPGMMGKLAEQAGLNSPEFKKLQQMGAVDQGNLAAVRQELAKVQTKVEVNVNLDEEALATKIAGVLERSLGQLVSTIEAKFRAERAQLQIGQQMRNAGGGQ